MRVLLTFAKSEAMRYTGHLDLHKALERTIRRSGLPLAYSQGYNPRPRISLASALPLGFTSQCEVADVRLEKTIPIPEIETALNRSSPPGLRFLDVEEINIRTPALQTRLESSEFVITFLDPLPELNTRLDRLWRAKTIPREKRGKNYDLRPLILEIHRMPDDEREHQRVQVRLAAREGATGRPEEVVLALQASPLAARIHRTRLIFKT